MLIVLHQGHSTPGRIGALLAGRGFALDIRRPSLGDPLPATLADDAGAIVFGGPMSANDDLDWVRREIGSLAVPLSEDRPLLGVCLGAQMLPANWAPGCSPIPTSAARSAITPSRRRRTRIFCARRRSRATPTIGIATASTCRAARGSWRPATAIPQPGLRRRLARAGAGVPPGSHLRDDLPLDDARGRAARPAGREPSRATNQLAGWFQHPRPVARWLEAMLPAWLTARSPSAETREPTPLERAPRGWRSAPTLEAGAGLSLGRASPR